MSVANGRLNASQLRRALLEYESEIDKAHKESRESLDLWKRVERERDTLLAERQKEHDSRIQWQGLVYLLCAEFDAALKRHVSQGTGTIATEPELLAAIRQIVSERDTATSERQNDQETIAGLRDWMRSANQFAWAHERNCPRHDADAPCNCGLDAFLSRPRPFIESWKSTLRQVRLDVEKAVHAEDCTSKPRRRAGMTYYETDTAEERNAPWYFESGPCNCFKARVLADIDKALGTVPGAGE